MIGEGLRTSGVEHVSAVADLHAQTRRAAAAFESSDVLLCPTLNVLPPPPGSLSASRGSVDAFFDVEFAATGWTAVANATGWAAITLPLGDVDGPAGRRAAARARRGDPPAPGSTARSGAAVGGSPPAGLRLTLTVDGLNPRVQIAEKSTRKSPRAPMARCSLGPAPALMEAAPTSGSPKRRPAAAAPVRRPRTRR